MTDQAAKAIGDRIRALLGVTDDDADARNAQIVAQFAKSAHKSVDTIYKMLRGETVARWVTLAEICRKLETTPNHLLGFEPQQDRQNQAEAPPYLAEVLETALRRFARLDEAEARVLTRVLLEVARMPPDPAVPVPPQDQARLRADGAISAVFPPRPL